MRRERIASARAGGFCGDKEAEVAAAEQLGDAVDVGGDDGAAGLAGFDESEAEGCFGTTFPCIR